LLHSVHVDQEYKHTCFRYHWPRKPSAWRRSPAASIGWKHTRDTQWCAQLCDYLIALDPNSKEPKQLKAEALEALAEQLLTATGRNYYLSVAQELRKDASR
jgi:hypothetical protein